MSPDFEKTFLNFIFKNQFTFVSRFVSDSEN